MTIASTPPGRTALAGGAGPDFAERFADVRGQVVPGSGHWILEEAPQTVIPAIIDFIG